MSAVEYRSARIVASYAEQDSVVEMVDATLKQWTDAGWTLHSQSMTTFIGTTKSSLALQSRYEIALLIFQRET